MCGIAGLTHAHNPQAVSAPVQALAQALAHRGPDGHGAVLADGVALVHTRLAIIDLAGGAQPLVSADNTLALVVNGEIYNFVELRAELEALGRCFATHSDSEVIVHAYAVWGMEFLSRLHGMYAFALHDRAQRRVILARDRLGIKPLYLSKTRTGWAWASEIKALLPLLEGAAEVHAAGLVGYLECQYASGRDTVVCGIERVLPGEVQVIDLATGTRSQRPYWSPMHAPVLDLSMTQACQRLDTLMDEVMRVHVRSDVPYGLFLSGGLDSSILLAWLSRLSATPIRTYSVGFADAPKGDEAQAAQHLAQRYGSHHTLLRPTLEQLMQRLPRVAWAADDLMRDFANLPTLMLAEAAGQELKVVFSGEGGDEAFGGYGRYRSSWLERSLKSFIHPGSGGFRTRGDFAGTWARRLYGPELAAVAHTWRLPVQQAWQAAPAEWSALQRMQSTDLLTALPDNLLVKNDRLLMAHGVEGRVPFLDHRLVEFGLGLPDRLKIADRQGKVIFRRWAQDLLPAEHVAAPKRGFNVPLGAWFAGERLQRLAVGLAHHPAICRWFRPEGVHALCAAQATTGRHSRHLLALLQFALWHQCFIEGKGADPGLVDPLEVLRSGAR